MPAENIRGVIHSSKYESRAQSRDSCAVIESGSRQSSGWADLSTPSGRGGLWLKLANFAPGSLTTDRKEYVLIAQKVRVPGICLSSLIIHTNVRWSQNNRTFICLMSTTGARRVSGVEGAKGRVNESMTVDESARICLAATFRFAPAVSLAGSNGR